MNERRFSAMEILRREWLVVAIAAVAGLAVAFLLANRAASTQYVATRNVTVLGLAGGPSNPPAPTDLINAATLPDVKRSAEESGGLDSGSLLGRVSVEVEPGDKRVVVYSATARSSEGAVAAVEAMSGATVGYVLDRFQLYTAVQQETIEEMDQRIEEMTARAERLEAQASSASPEQRAGFEAAAIFARNEAFEAEDEARRARQALEQLENSMVVGETTVRKVSIGGLQVSALLQGLLLGLVVGIAIAAVREWLLDRQRTAA